MSVKALVSSSSLLRFSYAFVLSSSGSKSELHDLWL